VTAAVRTAANAARLWHIRRGLRPFPRHRGTCPTSAARRAPYPRAMRSGWDNSMSPDAYSAHTIVYTALVNPVAGRGSAARVWRGVHRLLREAGVPVCVATTRSQEHAIELAASAAQRSQVVIAVGG